MAKHTPTPWHLGDERHGDWYIWGPDPKAYGYIAQVNACGTTTNPREEREANAAIIIRAVNSHATLVAALTRAGKALAADTSQSSLAQDIRDALKLAGEATDG